MAVSKVVLVAVSKVVLVAVTAGRGTVVASRLRRRSWSTTGPAECGSGPGLVRTMRDVNSPTQNR